MKKYRLMLLILLLCPGVHAGDMTIPEGVTYKPASEDINNKGKEFILRVMNKNEKERDTAAAGFIICGPVLWQRIGSKFEANEQGLINKTELSVPIAGGEVQKLTVGSWHMGQPITKIINETTDKELEKDVQQEKPVIRKLNEKELSIHWAMIGWDIEEPIFVVEVKERKYLFALSHSDGDFKISFVDDMAGYR